MPVAIICSNSLPEGALRFREGASKGKTFGGPGGIE
jgi:hypothetical protein